MKDCIKIYLHLSSDKLAQEEWQPKTNLEKLILDETEKFYLNKS